jgi:hypothetical protein
VLVPPPIPPEEELACALAAAARSPSAAATMSDLIRARFCDAATRREVASSISFGACGVS